MTNVNPENSVNSSHEGAEDTRRAGDHQAAHAAPESAAAGTGAGAAPAAKSGLPLRGLAMVLIAVAIMLGMWGLYALTSGSDDSGDSQNAAGTGTDATINAPVEGENGAGQAQPGAKPDEQNGEKPGEANAEGDKPGDNPGEKPGDKPEEKPEAKPGENGANTGAARPQAEIPVNVFNNSGQANYAAEESEKLKDAHFKVAEVGNISDQVMVVPRTTVYFPAGDANAENLAKEVAARYYGANVPAEAVAAYPQELSAEYTKDNAVVVVLAVPQA